MRAILTALALCIAVPSVAAADDLRLLSTADDIKGLEAVGRVDYTTAGQSGFCTGTLVTPTLVLTAAHCVFMPDGTAIPADAFSFRAGLRNGQSDGERRVRRMVIHPGYKYGEKPTHESVSTDLALLELDLGLSLPNVRPFPASGRLDRGDHVKVVSYAHDRADAPSMEDDCEVLNRSPRILTLSCSADFGASGAPVFVQTADGLSIVSVISAGGTLNEAPASFAVTVEAGLTTLMQQFARLPDVPSDRKMVRPGNRTGQGGTIRFIRPDG